MKNREEIITEMCYSYRHDYGLTRSDGDPPWVAGMTQSEREGLWRTMAQIFDNDIVPHMEFKNDKPSV
jgi:hypothetical protein